MPTTFGDPDHSRRVNHQEFMNGAAAPVGNEQTPPSPKRRTLPSTNSIPISFAYGSAVSTSNTRPSTNGPNRLLSSRANTASSQSNDQSYSSLLRDTSVNIANALQAATIPQNNMSSLSGTTLTGTSFKSLDSSSRRFKKPNSSSASKVVRDDAPPASEGFLRAKSPAELSQLTRQKSPFFEISLREADQQGGHQSMTAFLQGQQGPDSSRSLSLDEVVLQSRDYSVLDQDVATEEARQAGTEQPASKPSKVKRKQFKDDNKLYKPSNDDYEDDDDDYTDDDSGHARRRKKIAGRATLDGSLPTIGSSKKRKSTGGRKSISSRNRGIDEPSADDMSVRASPAHIDAPNAEELAVDDIVGGGEDTRMEDDEALMGGGEDPSLMQSSGPSFGIGQFVGLIWVSIAKLVFGAYAVVSLLLQQAYTLILSRPSAWFKANGRALIIVSVLLSLIAYQALAPTPSYDTDPAHPPRGSLFSSIFGRTPARSYAPSGQKPDNWDEFTSQLADIQHELSVLSSRARNGDIDASLLRSLDGRISLLDSNTAATKSQLNGDLSNIQRSLVDLQKRLDGSDSSRKFKDIDSSILGLQHTLSKVQSAVEASPAQLKELEKKVAAIYSAQQQLAAQQQQQATRQARPSKDNVSPAAEAYFQSLLNRAFNDRIALPDYAIFSAGGRVIPSLTTPTFEIPGRKSWTAKVLGVGGGGAHQGRPPATALTPDINVGHCWPFKGSAGHLGIYLKSHILVDAVTIDHASKDVAYDVTPAPRKVRVWGVVDGEHNVAKFKAHQDDLRAKYEGGSSSPDEKDEFLAKGPAIAPHQLSLLQLATFEYDVQSSTNIQTFPVSERIKALGIDVGVVMFQILSNHGNSEYTCLYRARVHGTPVSTSKASGSDDGELSGDDA